MKLNLVISFLKCKRYQYCTWKLEVNWAMMENEQVDANSTEMRMISSGLLSPTCRKTVWGHGFPLCAVNLKNEQVSYIEKFYLYIN